ncbi:MAG: alpha/beta fold hydrolase [Hyphomicrobiaceae bacterium]
MQVDLPEGALFYDVIDRTAPWNGEPETILFMHGVGARHDMWMGWLPALADRYRIILIGTRGAGHSAGIVNYSEWTLDGLSDDIVAVADRAGIEKFHVVGESAGGTAVLNLVARGPDRVMTATTLSTAHRGYQIERVKRWREDVAAKGVAWWSGEMMQHRFVAGAMSEAKTAWFRARQDESTAEAVLRKGDVLLATDLTEKLAGIKCPLLMLLPDHSPFVTPDIGIEILKHVPDAELSVIPNSKHGIFFSHDAFASQLLADFLARRGSASKN